MEEKGRQGKGERRELSKGEGRAEQGREEKGMGGEGRGDGKDHSLRKTTPSPSSDDWLRG